MAIGYADDKLVRGTEILELYKEAGWTLLQSRPAERIEAAIRGSERFLTARDGAKLVGFVMGISDGGLYAHVTELLVRPAWREKGLARELLERFLEVVPEAEVVTVFGEPDDKALYRALGFTPYTGGFMLRRG